MNVARDLHNLDRLDRLDSYWYEKAPGPGWAPTGWVRFSPFQDGPPLSVEDQSNMPLLIPDESRTPNRDDYVFAVPVARVAWNKWYALSERLGTLVQLYSMRYVVRMQTGSGNEKVKTIIVLPTGGQTDEDAVAAAAYLRLINHETCLIYILRCTDDPPSARKQMFIATGISRDLADAVQELEDPDESDNTAE